MHPEKEREIDEGKEGEKRGREARMIYNTLMNEGEINFVVIEGLLYASCGSEGFQQVLF